jgi:hypothetical protein
LEEAMALVFKLISQNRQKFAKRYQVVGDAEETPAGWALGVFLMSFFKSSDEEEHVEAGAVEDDDWW